jgi:hypothetical protein
MAAFLLSGICAISSGIIVSILWDQYQRNFSFSGTLVSIMSIDNTPFRERTFQSGCFVCAAVHNNMIYPQQKHHYRI